MSVFGIQLAVVFFHPSVVACIPHCVNNLNKQINSQQSLAVFQPPGCPMRLEQIKNFRWLLKKLATEPFCDNWKCVNTAGWIVKLCKTTDEILSSFACRWLLYLYLYLPDSERVQSWRWLFKNLTASCRLWLTPETLTKKVKLFNHLRKMQDAKTCKLIGKWADVCSFEG